VCIIQERLGGVRRIWFDLREGTVLGVNARIAGA
jgi:hypothetical protein